MTSESKTWDTLKTEYLRHVEKALSSVKHPRRKDILEDVTSHLDQRFAELEPRQQTWENFQAIITEMGPASDYAELLDPNAAPTGRNVSRKYLLWVGLAAVVVIAAAILLTTAKIEKRTAGEGLRKTFPETLNEAQKLYMNWTETYFTSFLDRNEYANLSDSAKKKLEEKWLKVLQGPWSQKYYHVINCLAAIKSKKAVNPLLKIATEHREKDNRDRWMATRALGIVGDESIVPELIHLVYHYNQNTRFWAQISLVRLVGANFASDWQAWGQWWNKEKDSPPFSSQKITWTSRADWSNQKFQEEKDKAFIEHLKQEKNGIQKPSVETYIVNFKPVSPFEPRTARELLNAFNENHPRGVRTHHYRTQVRDNALVGYICVDTKAGKEVIVNMLNESRKLALISAKPAAQRELEKLYAMGQPSLREAHAERYFADLPISRYYELLDGETVAELSNHERWTDGWFKVEEAYEAAAQGEKKAMIEQWMIEAKSNNFDKKTRAIAALGNVAAKEAVEILIEIAKEPKPVQGNRSKWMAVRALGKIGDAAAVPVLIDLLDHYNKDTRLYARVGLCEIAGVYFGDDKQQWRTWWQENQQKQEQIGEKNLVTN